MKSHLTLGAVALLGQALAQDTSPQVTLANGTATLRGSKCPTTEVNRFRGIRYAQAPTGDRRFAPPVAAVLSANGTLDATVPPPACPQYNELFGEAGPVSEDCLFVNVWVPAGAKADAKLPVKVWLYGGGNNAGGISNPLYDGCFANADTIQVSINYRLGPLGFLAYESLGVKGNFGIQDQLLGLRWVQDNIAAFGGDPTRVLLYGESAGATDTFQISSLPQAKDLIHAAIMESGGYSPLVTLGQASDANRVFVNNLNCSNADLSCLRSASLESLSTAFNNVGGRSALRPILDGTTITTQPSGPIVPSIIGTNSDEMSLFILADNIATFGNLNATSYNDYLMTTFGPDNAKLVNESFPLSKYSKAPLPALAAMTAVSTYSTFRCAARRQLRAAEARGVSVWTYDFGHTLSCSWHPKIPDLKPVLGLLGAAHSSEIPFVFGTTEHMPAPNGTCNFTAAERKISAFVVGAWANMTANATPGGDWPKFTANESKGLYIGNESWSFGTVDYTMCDLFDRIAAKVDGDATTNSTSPTQTPSSTSSSPSATSTGGAGTLLSSGVGFAALVPLLLCMFM